MRYFKEIGKQQAMSKKIIKLGRGMVLLYHFSVEDEYYHLVTKAERVVNEPYEGWIYWFEE